MRKFSIFAVLLLAAACGRVPQIRYYTFELDAPARAVAQQAQVLWIQPFSALPACAQDRLVFRDSAFEIQFDSYRRWIAPPPELLRERLVEQLRAAGSYRAVVTTPPRQAPYAVLSVQVVRFEEAVEAGKRGAVARLWFELADEQGAIRDSGYVEGKADIAAGGVDALVAAMREAAGRAFNALLGRF